MYIVAIAWLYVLLLVSVMQPTVFRGIMTFLGAGLLPLGLLLYLMGTPQRRRQRLRDEQTPSPPDDPPGGPTPQDTSTPASGRTEASSAEVSPQGPSR